jgi:DNA-binding transcriptional LysR family regulator
MGEYLAQNAGVDVELVIANSPSTLVEEGLDVVLRIGRLSDSSLVANRLGSTEYVTCAAPAYLDRRGRPARPGDLRDHVAIAPGRRDEELLTQWSFTRLEEHETVEVPVAVVIRDGVGVTDACIGEGGVARIYDVSAAHHLANGELEAIIQDWSAGSQDVYALLPGRRNVPAKVRSFVEFARSLVRAGRRRTPIASS